MISARAARGVVCGENWLSFGPEPILFLILRQKSRKRSGNYNK